ncbi:hypothetical protein K501DRAFT_278957 [Backusella circina FSU 941]|nr:hypothetical protein K501DRAFT_278957 [Backusella circina FSU 941]
MFHSSHALITNGTVTITELDEALALINQNVEINKYLTTTTDLCKLKTRSLLWGNAKEAETCGKVELIIASDVLYEAQFFEDLVKTFVHLSTKNTRIYIGYKRRGFDEAEEKRFWSLCSEYYSVKLLEYNGKQDDDDCLVPRTTLGTGVQLYRLLPLGDKFT